MHEFQNTTHALPKSWQVMQTRIVLAYEFRKPKKNRILLQTGSVGWCWPRNLVGLALCSHWKHAAFIMVHRDDIKVFKIVICYDFQDFLSKTSTKSHIVCASLVTCSALWDVMRCLYKNSTNYFSTHYFFHRQVPRERKMKKRVILFANSILAQMLNSNISKSNGWKGFHVKINV